MNTKFDGTFPEGQFVIDGYSTPFRLDRNIHGGGVLLYVREDILVNSLTSIYFLIILKVFM